jgi:hypothetical protein
MHNEEGKLFDAVFHKLLGLGVAIIALAALVWFIWAIARTSAITNDASQPAAPAGGGSSMHQSPADVPPLANARHAARARVAPPDRMIELFFRPVASLVAGVHAWLDRLPPALAHPARNAAFFAGGPS